MILLLLLLIPLIAGTLAWFSGRWSDVWPRWISLAAACASFVLGLVLWIGTFGGAILTTQNTWIEELDWAWIPQFGIHFHLAMDGLSLLLVMLTSFLGIVSVLASWREIRTRIGFFHFNLMWVLAGITAVFIAMDLFFFYFAWELMLIPMYFLIAVWGHERRVYAATKFFLFTQISSLLMLISILALYFIHYRVTGTYSFEYLQLLGTPLAASTERWLMLGFFVAFTVKLPMIPLHTWLADAHTEAPTAGSIILAGLLLKTGAYGLLRFVVPLFPGAARDLAPLAMALGAAGILYGAILAIGQTDLKRLVAYTSISHMGFVLLGIFAWNELALQGAMVTIVSHGVSTGALFLLVGELQERAHTRDLARMGGLWSTIPRWSGALLFFALASLGLPGLGDFVGEFLVLLGAYRVSVLLTAAGTIGVLFATAYALRLIQRVAHGPNSNSWRLVDLSPRETVTAALMGAVIIWLGVYPRAVLNTFQPAMIRMQQYRQSGFGNRNSGISAREIRIPNSKFQIPDPESRFTNPESRVPSPGNRK